MPRETLLARALVELADTLVADFDVVELLTRLTDRCVEVLEVGAAGIMLAGPDGEPPPPQPPAGPISPLKLSPPGSAPSRHCPCGSGARLLAHSTCSALT